MNAARKRKLLKARAERKQNENRQIIEYLTVETLQTLPNDGTDEEPLFCVDGVYEGTRKIGARERGEWRVEIKKQEFLVNSAYRPHFSKLEPETGCELVLAILAGRTADEKGLVSVDTVDVAS